MRPAILDRLFAPVTALPGIGPQSAKLFERLAGPLVADLVWHLPTGIVDRRAAPALRDTEHEAIVTVRLRVEGHEPGHGRRPCRVSCSEGTKTLTLVYFNVKGDYLTRMLPVGGERIVSGLHQLRGRIGRGGAADLELLIAVAHDAARPVLDRDRRLEGPSGAARRTLLYPFRRDEAVQYLRAG